jgi:hypothetical protein
MQVDSHRYGFPYFTSDIEAQRAAEEAEFYGRIKTAVSGWREALEGLRHDYGEEKMTEILRNNAARLAFEETARTVGANWKNIPLANFRWSTLDSSPVRVDLDNWLTQGRLYDFCQMCSPDKSRSMGEYLTEEGAFWFLPGDRSKLMAVPVCLNWGNYNNQPQVVSFTELKADEAGRWVSGETMMLSEGALVVNPLLSRMMEQGSERAHQQRKDAYLAGRHQENGKVQEGLSIDEVILSRAKAAIELFGSFSRPFLVGDRKDLFQLNYNSGQRDGSAPRLVLSLLYRPNKAMEQKEFEKHTAQIKAMEKSIGKPWVELGDQEHIQEVLEKLCSLANQCPDSGKKNFALLARLLGKNKGFDPLRIQLTSSPRDLNQYQSEVRITFTQGDKGGLF